MAVPSVMADLSVTAASNSPAGSESPTAGDDFLRAVQAIIRTTNAKGSDIASATTTDIGAATAEFVDVTGTTTITGLGTIAAGIRRTVRFTGALTLTHNATSLILPGGVNITTANGDVAQFRSLGSGNWVCTNYMKKDGLGVIASELQKQTYTAFTTGGTSTAYTLTPTPAIAANTTNQRFNVTLNAAPGASPTLAVSGQTAKNFKYYDNTGTKQFINSTVAPSGWNSDVIYDGTDWVMLNTVINGKRIAQIVTTQVGTVATGTTVIPFDNTIPQITEGDQYMSLAITPINASSTLEIDVTISLASSVLNNLAAALFQDATANALAAMGIVGSSNNNETITFKHIMTAGTTSSTTFRVRGGAGSAGTTTFNGTGGVQLYGGVMSSRITIKEILP